MASDHSIYENLKQLGKKTPFPESPEKAVLERVMCRINGWLRASLLNFIWGPSAIMALFTKIARSQ